MDYSSIIIVLISIIIGFLVGKYIYDKAKWADKRKSLDAEWELRLNNIINKYENKFLEIENKNKLEIKNIIHNWGLRYVNDLAEIKDIVKSTEKYMRLDAIKRSRRTLLGQLWEQVSPYLPKFPFKPSDMKFLGSPIDFIIF